MKQGIILIAVSMLAGTLLNSCQSAEKKVDNAQEKVQTAEENLKTAEMNAEQQRAKDAQEWQIFKAENEAKIKANEAQIAVYRTEIKTAGKKSDVAASKKIDELEQKNLDMRHRIDSYDKSMSDWSAYKREFSHDMDELGQAFKDLTVNNKK